ncbi:bifunctional 4-hydroxy-2-oxoglutarate aldolase/2-dehydro-3-deoxy-phosphogluconate aldolase [Enterococcus sp. MJM12]|uniref:Bifunctional 4-hydroxy-2-oxoglutarate aldolase/2-dehydro-3-deoxy-phosphogluconate aldolase n=1 Tax=Candidatus Enterococcus myersii TaxID=2815322 RepID=A0ABS3H4M9_9ENTE|nr:MULTISPECIES: bifunctional 4-hydroxy-2-oxoglutarate aldolase/2-dehydro-3-deoxy-phosphogluconate aldolase [Enterococcus]MBO0448421.1 bifunctional 4-hydroxy-2-oxoglutarate aldolase/2-dehydro-3-deoxy-phosphogluconate aldolase [Enterococcus sp. MJM12]MCD1024335.1 bifunctional 4-hydroxy-2-oxoglutarate aldolase/2-dehydro-3-deoxy-phosphogluconate aldolase [Enterococcus sp. SMC-9]MDT2739823.1 bifunctional 4-hydroxy-2-oxoglutarate aldolase/2-dehydro-3-deoxy-phosphogluconate aldolase [Enterococcus cani
MKLEEYPKLTIIMRGYSFEQAEAILKAMNGFEKDYAVEMTLNTENALENIKRLNAQFGDKIKIGAGTVRTIEDAKAAYAAGAKFLLGPHVFTKEMLAFANEKNILAVPAAMTPSEIDEMFKNGADIVKVFPAAVVTPRFFKDVQAPLGKLPLMGVGGVSTDNARAFFENQASYLGLGSGMFNKEDLKELNIPNLAKSLQLLLERIK